jgi:hypothetical protein
MEDVPSVDYHAMATAAVNEALLTIVPDAVKELYATDPAWLTGGHLRTPHGLGSVYTKLCSPNYEYELIEKKFPVLWEQLTEWGKASSAQTLARRDLQDKLTTAIIQCTTRKQAVATMPELEKYLPVDGSAAPIKLLPTTGDLVAELVSAGWQKGGQHVENADT